MVHKLHHIVYKKDNDIMQKQAVQAGNGWGFWAGWGAAFLGFPIGGLAGMGVAGAITGVPQAALGGLATGAVIGAAQWLVLRRRLSLDYWWIVATAGGMSAGLALAVALLGIDTGDNSLPLRGLITGALIGISQYFVLRGLTNRAALWAAVVTLGWAIGWLVTRAAGVDLSPNFTVFGSTGAWAFQLLTGLALAWILRDKQAA
jgi:hypothetical protein